MESKNSSGPDRIDYRESEEDLTEVHAAILRENPEPSASQTPIPLWLIVVCLVAVTWAGVYFGIFHGGLRGDVFNDRLSSPDLLFPQAQATTVSTAPVAELSLAERGKAVYAQCQPCHQAGGGGVPGAFPPLANSDYVLQSEKRLIAILLKGFSGPVTVHGGNFNGVMPAWEKTLDDKKIASVASYIRSSWGNTAAEITPEKVALGRKEFEARTAPWTAGEIESVSGDFAGGAAAPAADAKPAEAGKPAAAAGEAKPAGEADAALIALGKTQYATICVACHQATGLGLPPVFPPLAKSEFVNGDPKRMIAIILHGVTGPITVEGKPYNGAMPPLGMTLDDKKIAGIVSYVRSSFGNTSSGVTPEMVAAVRADTATHAAPWTEAELNAFVDPAAPTTK